jgi:signal transduction histidine kinase
LETWLEDQGIENGWEFAPMLVSLGYDTNELTGLAENFTVGQFPAVITSLSSTYTIYSLLGEIGQGTERITEIVKALKTYTYMDQAPVQAVDVHEGLNNTLVMLRSRLKAGINVRREYADDLPRIEAYGSELNQVWTNIIDNAITAMEGQGEIILRTRRDGQWVVVEIEDNGPGIPEAIQSKIFDPFFTTKPPGEGTGLGLNISHNIVVQKHQGKITVHSQPGQTCFQVRLPINFEIAQ